jgi:phosphomevalonate kinase
VIARAPGKVVLSGAYAVLEGAPALVAAVDRYVVADSDREPDRLTAEVATALTQLTQTSASRAPWFDASALRDTSHDRKLGLGSSAAILVASLAALAAQATDEQHQSPGSDDPSLADQVFAPALLAHRIAQRGGSGIDVAASTFGGVLCFQQAAREGELPSHEPVKLPSGLHVRVWSSLVSASTADMLTRVRTLRETRKAEYQRIMKQLGDASQRARGARDATAFVDACRQQLTGLTELGELSGAPIVTAEVLAFAQRVQARGDVVFPSGAGGGDVVLWVSDQPADAEVELVGRQSGLFPLALSLGARGVHADRTAKTATPRIETAS